MKKATETKAVSEKKRAPRKNPVALERGPGGHFLPRTILSPKPTPKAEENPTSDFDEFEDYFPATKKKKRPPTHNPFIAGPPSRNPGKVELVFKGTLQTGAGSLGGFVFNLVAGETLASMEVQNETLRQTIGYALAFAPAVAFSTILRTPALWKDAMAGAALYDVWMGLARKFNLGQTAPSPEFATPEAAER